MFFCFCFYYVKSNNQDKFRGHASTHLNEFFLNPFTSHLHFIIFFMSCMIFLPYFYKHDDFIEGNEKFKLGGEDLEKLNNFLKFLNF